jgi:hypothetical protein
MAAKTTVASVPAQLTPEERAATIAALQQQLLSGLGNKSPAGNGVWGWVGDKLSTTGQGMSSVVAGASAAVDNFGLHYNSEKLRQQERTAAMAAKLAEQLLTSRGL